MALLIDTRTKRKKEKTKAAQTRDYAFVEDCAVRIIIAIVEVTTCLLQCEHQSQNEISISCEIKHAIF